jgi:hypothetical protein
MSDLQCVTYVIPEPLQVFDSLGTLDFTNSATGPGCGLDVFKATNVDRADLACFNERVPN